MSDPQGYCQFTNVVAIESATMTGTAGISPNAASLTILPQVDTIEEYGDLTFSFGGDSLTFIECKADCGTFERDASGMVWHITVFDRRWKWKYGHIGGQYNWRKPDGKVIESTKKTPQELARLCLDAMAEGEWDLSQLPNDSNPRIVWDAENPAEALASLCDSLGCLVVPSLTSRTGKICLAGVGAELPTNAIESASITQDPPEMPSRIGVLCGPDLFELELPLEAVGVDVDTRETIKKLDDLSYKPTTSGGWSDLLDDTYRPESTDEAYNERFNAAKRSVWKWYRVKIPSEGLTVPGYNKVIRSLDSIEITGSIVRTVEDTLDESTGDGTTTTTAKQRRKPAYVYGIWRHTGRDGETGNNASTIAQEDTETQKTPVHFSIDADRRLVIFDKPVYKNAGTEPDTQPAEPELYLVTACRILDTETRQPVRSYKYKETAGVEYDTATMWIRHDEIVLAHTSTNEEGVNIAEVREECDYYIDAKYSELQPVTGQTATYMGLIGVDLDGAIRQITYNVGREGATTVVSRNSENNLRTLPYRSKRKDQRQTAILKKAEAERTFRGSADDRSGDVKDIA